MVIYVSYILHPLALPKVTVCVMKGSILKGDLWCFVND